MAIEYHLEIDGIQGESPASKHTDHIELLSWSWGASNPTTIVGSGLSAGKVSVSDLSFTKKVDKATPALLKLVFQGDHKATAYLYAAKQTGQKNPEDYLKIKFEEVYVSSFQVGGSHGEDVGVESVSLSFGKVTFDYKAQHKDGTLKPAGTAIYDLRAREAG